MSVIDENLNFCIKIKDIEKECCHEFEQKVDNIQDIVLKLLEDGFKTNRFVYNGTMQLNNDDKLQDLLDKNKQLRHDISCKLGEVENRKVKYESFKKDQELLSQEIKDTHEAFLMARKLYKKYLKMYYTIESRSNNVQTIFVQFFTESKKESVIYSVRLLHNTISGRYELLSTFPEVNMQKALQKRLQETNDVPELLCCVREAFLVMKNSKTK